MNEVDASSIPEAFREHFDPERPEWLDITLARLIRFALIELERGTRKGTLPSASWTEPVIRLAYCIPFQGKRSSDTILDDLRRGLATLPQSKQREIGNAFLVHQGLRVMEYLTGSTEGFSFTRPETPQIVLPDPGEKPHHLGGPIPSGRYILVLGAAPFALGKPSEREAGNRPYGPPVSKYAEEIRRIRTAFSSHLHSLGASLEFFVNSPVYDRQENALLWSYGIRLHLADEVKRESRRRKKWSFIRALKSNVDRLVECSIEGSRIQTPEVKLIIPGIEELDWRQRSAVEQTLDGMGKLQTLGIKETGMPGRFEYVKEGSADRSEITKAFVRYLSTKKKNFGFQSNFGPFMKQEPLVQHFSQSERTRLEEALRAKFDALWKESRKISH